MKRSFGPDKDTTPITKKVCFRPVQESKIKQDLDHDVLFNSHSYKNIGVPVELSKVNP